MDGAESLPVSDVVVRAGVSADAAGINAIYNHFVRETAITFDVEPWDESRRRTWINENFADPPWFLRVAECRGELVGFAYNGRFRPRAAYDSSTEVTVYTQPEVAPRGTASRLYDALFDAIAGTDLHRAYAIIALPNPASIALHLKFGFRHVGTLGEVGTKFGRRIDVAWYEKALDAD